MATYEEIIDRCEAEFGGELPDINAAGGATYQDRARRLLEEAEKQGERFSEEDEAVIKATAE